MSNNCILLTCDKAYLKAAWFVAWQLKFIPGLDADVVVCSGEDLGPVGSVGAMHRTIEMPGFIQHLPLNERLREFTYWRIPAIENLAKLYKRVLYLDTDLFVNSSRLPELFSLDMRGHAIAAVLDVHQSVRPKRQVAEFEALRLSHSSYFNAGVLLIDSKAWLAQGAYQRMVDLCERHGHVLHRHDQSLLNLAFKDDWLELSPVWNWQYSYRNAFLTEWVSPQLIHFSGVRKPWHPPSGTIPRRYRERYADFLRSLGEPVGDVAQVDEAPELAQQGKALLKCLWYFRAWSRYLSRFDTALTTVSHRRA